jgi:hypothetical protein
MVVSDSPERPDAKTDVAILCGPTEDRQGQRLIRLREGELQAGEVRAVRQGAPLHGRELVRLSPREKTPQVCDVEVLHPAEAPPGDRVGPAQVATDRYRDNWELIFGSGAKAN